jgi:hypothetical protein
MCKWRLFFVITLISLQILCTSSLVRAELDDRQANLVVTTAERICGVISANGSTTNAQAKGVVKLELSQLASNLDSAGAQGSGVITTDAYQGVVREQLATVLKYQMDCRLQVFQILILKISPGYQPPPPPPRPPPVVVDAPGSLPCQTKQVAEWLDQHGIYGDKPFDINIYDDSVNWVVGGRPEWKKKSDVFKEENIFRKIYPTQRYNPILNTSSAIMSGGQCVFTQDVEGYKQSATGAIVMNNFRFGFTIRNNASGPRIVERQTDVLKR